MNQTYTLYDCDRLQIQADSEEQSNLLQSTRVFIKNIYWNGICMQITQKINKWGGGLEGEPGRNGALQSAGGGGGGGLHTFGRYAPKMLSALRRAVPRLRNALYQTVIVQLVSGFMNSIRGFHLKAHILCKLKATRRDFRL
jgi:hypothetical protein